MREKEISFETFFFLVHGVIALLLWNEMALLWVAECCCLFFYFLFFYNEMLFFKPVFSIEKSRLLHHLFIFSKNLKLTIIKHRLLSQHSAAIFPTTTLINDLQPVLTYIQGCCHAS